MNERFEDYEDEDGDEDFYEEYTVPADMINKWKEAEFNIHESELNLAILDQVIKTLSNSWWWKLRGVNSKMQQINKLYSAMHAMINSNNIIHS